jgi:hypothetical protein
MLLSTTNTSGVADSTNCSIMNLDLNSGSLVWNFDVTPYGKVSGFKGGFYAQFPVSENLQEDNSQDPIVVVSGYSAGALALGK